MFERTKIMLDKALMNAKKLVEARIYDPQSIESNIVPKKIGVYLWRTKKDNTIIYVGRAFGKEGLYKRIINQHLSNSYTKSVLRKQISEENNLNLKEESADFIRANFAFSFIAFENEMKNIASLIEILLIKEFKPKYNRAEKF